MDIKILHLIEGAKRATGLAVIIDVFRAFSTACYMINNGAIKIIPVGDIQIAYQLKKRNPDFLLAGERGSRIQPGFNYGNSPSMIEYVNFENQTVIQTTSAGTQGIVNAFQAEEVITGSFVNANSIIDYIRLRKSEQVSLVCMGISGLEKGDEDYLCAKYIKDSLENRFTDFKQIKEKLKFSPCATNFFDTTQDWIPERDFDLCLSLNRFNFILKAQPFQDNLKCLRRIDLSES